MERRNRQGGDIPLFSDLGDAARASINCGLEGPSSGGESPVGDESAGGRRTIETGWGSSRVPVLTQGVPAKVGSPWTARRSTTTMDTGSRSRPLPIPISSWGIVRVPMGTNSSATPNSRHDNSSRGRLRLPLSFGWWAEQSSDLRPVDCESHKATIAHHRPLPAMSVPPAFSPLALATPTAHHRRLAGSAFADSMSTRFLP